VSVCFFFFKQKTAYEMTNCDWSSDVCPILPIVPVAVEGTRHVMLKDRLMTCPGHVRLRVLPPVSTSGYDTSRARELAGVIERQVRADVESLQAQAASA
jgi:1-acyl-sn-glycerol-3-phosphate acyltransferase